MRSKRLTITIGILSMALLISAACASDGSDEPVATTARPEPTEAPAASAAPAGNAADGANVFLDNGCSACHSTGANKVIGPGLAGILARAESRGTGQTAEEYIRTSIIDPSAFVVEDFPDNVMPSTFGTSISDSDLQDLIAYLSTLN